MLRGPHSSTAIPGLAKFGFPGMEAALTSGSGKITFTGTCLFQLSARFASLEANLRRSQTAIHSNSNCIPERTGRSFLAGESVPITSFVASTIPCSTMDRHKVETIVVRLFATIYLVDATAEFSENRQDHDFDLQTFALCKNCYKMV